MDRKNRNNHSVNDCGPIHTRDSFHNLLYWFALDSAGLNFSRLKI